jgi:hypothetical protein
MSFNWRLLLAPPAVLDYVVEHEVCHLEVMDHSRLALLAARVPDWRALGLAAPLRFDSRALNRAPQGGIAVSPPTIVSLAAHTARPRTTEPSPDVDARMDERAQRCGPSARRGPHWLGP